MKDSKIRYADNEDDKRFKNCRIIIYSSWMFAKVGLFVLILEIRLYKSYEWNIQDWVIWLCHFICTLFSSGVYLNKLLL